MPHPPQILVIGEQTPLETHGCCWLAGLRCARIVPATPSDARISLVEPGAFDLVIINAPSSEMERYLCFAEQVRERARDVPILFLAGTSSEDIAIRALRAGVDDYFRQPVDSQQVVEAIERFLTRVQDDPPTEARLNGGDVMIGRSRALSSLRDYIAKVAPTDSTVLITGETGTGKELVAELVHKNSPRHAKPFVVINCAAMPDTLIESELFGYERGAFTGAYGASEGKLKVANGGTVFLDEIGDLSPYAQTRLLRVIEHKEIQPLGGRSPAPLNVRIVAATNQDLYTLALQKQFRRDLYYRLNVARIQLPPLKERREDVELLCKHFIRVFNAVFGRRVDGFTADAWSALLCHDWPGNIRELRNLLESVFVALPSNTITLADLPEPFQSLRTQLTASTDDERNRLLTALFAMNWNVSAVAKHLHWSRMTLYRKLAKYRIARERRPSHSA